MCDSCCASVCDTDDAWSRLRACRPRQPPPQWRRSATTMLLAGRRRRVDESGSGCRSSLDSNTKQDFKVLLPVAAAAAATDAGTTAGPSSNSQNQSHCLQLRAGELGGAASVWSGLPPPPSRSPVCLLVSTTDRRRQSGRVVCCCFCSGRGRTNKHVTPTVRSAANWTKRISAPSAAGSNSARHRAERRHRDQDKRRSFD